MQWMLLIAAKTCGDLLLPHFEISLQIGHTCAIHFRMILRDDYIIMLSLVSGNLYTKHTLCNVPCNSHVHGFLQYSIRHIHNAVRKINGSASQIFCFTSYISKLHSKNDTQNIFNTNNMTWIAVATYSDGKVPQKATPYTMM